MKKTTAKLLRVVRLDDSDTQIYLRCAKPGEWAIPGTFVFWDVEPNSLSGKHQQAFARGFLGIESYGWSSLVVVAEISLAELDQVTRQLATHLIECYGAPDMMAALPAAREEIEFAVGLCDHQLNTLIALDRTFNDQEICESFRVVLPATAVDHGQLKLWGVE